MNRLNAYLVRNQCGSLQVTVFAKNKDEAGSYVLGFYKRGAVIISFIKQI